MKEFAERANNLGVKIYLPSEEHDTLLLLWWRELIASNDFDRVLPRKAKKLSSFMQIFQPPTLLVFTHDDNNRIWMASWFDMFADENSGVFMHFWGREDMRHTRHGIAVTHLVYDFATTAWPVIIGVTKHEDLLRIHRKVGYNIVGYIPQMLDGSDAWILYLNRPLYEKSKFYRTGEKVNGKWQNQIRRRDASGDAASNSRVLVRDRATA